MNIRNLLVSAAVAALTSAAFAQWTTIYSDNFDSATTATTGDSVNAIGVYSGSNVYATKAGAGLAASGGTLAMDGNVAGQFQAVAYFTGAGSVVDLSNSATSGIKLEFDYTIQTASTSLFRIGLFNSQADSTGAYTRATLGTDGSLSGGNSTNASVANQSATVTASAPFATWSGYYLGLNNQNSSGGISSRLDQRAFGGSGIMVSTSGLNLRYMSGNTQTFNSANGSVGTTAQAAVTDGSVSYHLSYTVAMIDANTLSFTTLLTNNADSSVVLSKTDTTTSINNSDWQTAITSGSTGAALLGRLMGGYKFDSLAFNPGSSGSVTIDNLQVSTIPEPATYAACLGALSLLVVGFRRFRR